MTPAELAIAVLLADRSDLNRTGVFSCACDGPRTAIAAVSEQPRELPALRLDGTLKTSPPLVYDGYHWRMERERRILREEPHQAPTTYLRRFWVGSNVPAQTEGRREQGSRAR